MAGVQVVWFKRDLRISDHEPLFSAARRGPVIPLFLFEPAFWKQPDVSVRHFNFLLECLDDLKERLAVWGQPLVTRTGDAVQVLQELHRDHHIDTLWSHQETWNGWTYARDLRVKDWCRSAGIPWKEPTQYGVQRAMGSRNGWARRWDKQMAAPPYPEPNYSTSVEINQGSFPEPKELGLSSDSCQERQEGGRTLALHTLSTFLQERGGTYQKDMSSPLSAFKACSRLSPYLAFGVISMRETYQAAETQKKKLRTSTSPDRHTWLKSLHAFTGRLHWHCHFMQKLEDDPLIEFESLHPMLRAIRKPHDNHEALLAAWSEGRTGFPMIDACMRALHRTGWINFRMRAMLMSFAAYHLWLPWRKPALHLARQFLDYEPGIHYSQCQMQSGLTGINSIRIYNPIKQGIDHDPDAHFIKKWVPELRSISPARIHDLNTLHTVCADYPAPIVSEKQARKYAADTLFVLRKDTEFQAVADAIREKHGSRKSGLRRSSNAMKPTKRNQSTSTSHPAKKNPQQLELGL